MLLTTVDEVEGGDGSHVKLLGDLASELLSVVGAVVVLTGDGALGASHVAADNEVDTVAVILLAVVLANDHVLEGFTGSGHLHRVREVGEGDLVVALELVLLEGQVGLVADSTRDIILLGRANGGVHENDVVIDNGGGSEEELNVGTVKGVTALEDDDVLVLGEHLAELAGGHAGNVTGGELETLEGTREVGVATLKGNHHGTGVGELGGLVAVVGLLDLIGGVALLDVHDSEVLTLVLKKNLLADSEVLTVSVENDGKTEEDAVGKAVVLHDGVVVAGVHEGGERGESTVHEELDVTGVTVRELHDSVNRALEGLLLGLVLHHEVHEVTTVGGDAGAHGTGREAQRELREGRLAGAGHHHAGGGAAESAERLHLGEGAKAETSTCNADLLLLLHDRSSHIYLFFSLQGTSKTSN